MHFSRFWSAFFSIFCLIYLGLWYFSETRFDKSGLLVGQKAPELSFNMVGLGPGSLNELKGQVVLVHFWAEWCAACLEEMPSIKVLEKKLHSQPFMILAVNVDGEKARAGIEAMGKQLPEHTAWSVSDFQLEQFNVRSLPYSVVVDAEGIVRGTYLGARNWDSTNVIKELKSFLP